MKGLDIVAMGAALPKKIVTNDDLSKIVDTSDEWIKSRTGICKRYMCEDETCTSLAIEAAKKAIEDGNIDINEIGIVIVATSTGEYSFPATACLVSKELGIGKDVMAFDISAACSGFLYGIKLCRNLLLDSKKKYALLIGSEHMTRLVDFEDRSTCVLFGDGAGAAVVELSDSMFLHNSWTDGDSETLICKGNGYENGKIYMDGPEVFKFAVKVIKQGIDTILEQASLSIDDIGYVVCHQANERIIDHISKKYKQSEGKFYKNIANYANTSAASIPIALEDMKRKGLLKRGIKIILVGFGAGFTWSSALITV